MSDSPALKRPHAAVIVAAVFIILLIGVNIFIEQERNRVITTLGVIVLFVSLFFFIPPFILLKKYGSVKPGAPFFKTNTRVDQGVFGLIRHPQYFGYMLFSGGFAAISQHYLAIIFSLAAIFFLYVQAVQEEIYCRRQMGDSYTDYMERIPRFNLILCVWRYLRQTRK